jgi:hypothetical protein
MIASMGEASAVPSGRADSGFDDRRQPAKVVRFFRFLASRAIRPIAPKVFRT